MRTTELKRIEYARLTRKGSDRKRLSHGPQAGYQLRTPYWPGAKLCHGIRVGYTVEHRYFSVIPRAGFCRSGFSNEYVEATSDEVDAETTFAHYFDIPVVSIGIGLGGGVSWLRQAFTSRGDAPVRNSVGDHLDAVLSLMWDLPRGFYIATELAGQVYFFRSQAEANAEEKTVAVPTARTLAGFGKRF